MKIIVLCGGGAMGMVTVRDLTESPDVSEVIIGEASLKQAEKVATWTGSEKVSLREVNVTAYARKRKVKVLETSQTSYTI